MPARIRKTLPNHPTAVDPRTGRPLRAIAVLPSGRAVWPIAGGSGEGEGGEGGEGQGAPPAGQGSGDSGFPANTPLEQMNAAQREAYWKHQAQNWQSRAKGNYAQLQELGIRSAEDVAAVKEKVQKYDKTQYDLSSEHERALADATKAVSEAKDAEYRPLLVRAKFEAVAAGRLDDDALNTLLEPLDLAKFLTADGKVDADKVTAYVDGIAPAKGTVQIRRGPTATAHSGGAGTGRVPVGSGAFGESGRAMAQKRFGVKST